MDDYDEWVAFLRRVEDAARTVLRAAAIGTGVIVALAVASCAGWLS